MEISRKCFASMLCLTTAFCHDAMGQSPTSGTLTVSVDTPVAQIGARAAGSRFIRLPSLGFQFVIEAKCAADLSPVSLSLSIADTRKSLGAAEIPADTGLSVSLKIPAPQIGPVAVDDFCISTDEISSLPSDDQAIVTNSFTVSSVLSMQASLLCANDTDSQMIYVSKPLDVTLDCAITGL